MTTYISVIAPENSMSTSCLSSMLRLQHTRYQGSIMIDISRSVQESLSKAKNLESIGRIVLVHESCGVSSDFITKDHPHPIVCAGYGQSAIDWERIVSGFPYETEAECAREGIVYNFDITKSTPTGTEYVKTDECESKIISCSPDAIDKLESSLDTSTYTLRSPSHIYVQADTLHNVEFCFVGSFIDKYKSQS